MKQYHKPGPTAKCKSLKAPNCGNGLGGMEIGTTT